MSLELYPLHAEEFKAWMGYCRRQDCGFGLYAYDELGAGPWDLPAEFSYLIAPDYARPNEIVRITPSIKSQQFHAEIRLRIAAFNLFEDGDTRSFPQC
jgi:hypothetical protein